MRIVNFGGCFDSNHVPTSSCVTLNMTPVGTSGRLHRQTFTSPEPSVLSNGQSVLTISKNNKQQTTNKQQHTTNNNNNNTQHQNMATPSVLKQLANQSNLKDLDEGQRSGAFMPFANGPRNCVGQPLAHVILRIMLARIVDRYKVIDKRMEHGGDSGKLSAMDLRKDMQAGFTVLPSGGVRLSLQRRRSTIKED